MASWVGSQHSYPVARQKDDEQRKIQDRPIMRSATSYNADYGFVKPATRFTPSQMMYRLSFKPATPIVLLSAKSQGQTQTVI
jgi:hypothetical protein